VPPKLAGIKGLKRAYLGNGNWRDDRRNQCGILVCSIQEIFFSEGDRPQLSREAKIPQGDLCSLRIPDAHPKLDQTVTDGGVQTYLMIVQRFFAFPGVHIIDLRLN